MLTTSGFEGRLELVDVITGFNKSESRVKMKKSLSERQKSRGHRYK